MTARAAARHLGALLPEALVTASGRYVHVRPLDAPLAVPPETLTPEQAQQRVIALRRNESTVQPEGLPAAESVPVAGPGLAPVSPACGRAAGGAPPAGGYERLTCANLADLGIEGFAAHDPAHQTVEDAHCACWQDPPLTYEQGSWFGPSALDVQACRRPHRLVLGGYVLDLCCECAPETGWAELGQEIEERKAAAHVLAVLEAQEAAAGLEGRRR